jgi:pimeloyl-ACP methyl ester carboxylesterase
MKLHFKKFGNGEPLLIIHGLFGMSDNWIGIAKDLSQKYLVYILDMRNHGRSPHVDSFTYPEMVEDIYEFLTDFNHRQVSIIGHSMGGKIAMNFALEYPHRIKKLVVIDIAPRRYPVFHQEILQGLQSIKLHNLTTRNEADNQLANFVSSKRIRQFLLKNIYRKDDGSYAWRINLPVIIKNIEEISCEISSKIAFEQPTLFIKGGASEYITQQDESEIKSQFSASKILTIPDASHWVHSEAPDAVYEAINNFLA